MTSKSVIWQKQELLQEYLDIWLETNVLQSKWLTSGPIKVYMRKSPLPGPGGALVSALTLANISVGQKSQGLGSFTAVLEWMLRQDVRVLKIENVHSLIIQRAMERRGWIKDNMDPPSYMQVT